jgi:hypothetical protein
MQYLAASLVILSIGAAAPAQDRFDMRVRNDFFIPRSAFRAAPPCYSPPCTTSCAGVLRPPSCTFTLANSNGNGR